jgi:multidrug resistance efflux pump
MEENEKIDSQKAIEIRSEEIDEILGRKPNNLIRYGITIIFLVIVLILTGSYFYKYPDVINAPVTITTENIPVNLVAKVNGKLSKLFVKNQQLVNKDEILGIIENPANYNDIQMLKSKLDSLSYCFKISGATSLKNIDTVNFDEAYILGDIQAAYILFLKSLNDFNMFIISDFQHKKIQSIKQQKQRYYALQKKIVNQSKFSMEQLELMQSQFTRDSNLYQNNAISKAEFEKSKDALLQNKYSFENAQSSIDNSKITISQLEQSILELEQQYDEQCRQLYNQLSNNYETLLNQIKTWEQTYLLITPIKGKVSFTKFWSENQDIVAGENVLTIVPDKPEKITGKIQLAVAGSGKVKTGQKVNIKLDNYPYMEYGVLTGTIQNISLVAIENNYYVEVSLPNGLKTNYNKSLPFSNQLQGSAEIVTDDIRLIERFIQPIKSLVLKNSD